MSDAETHPAQDERLSDLLAARARGASDARLAIDVAVGSLAIIAALFWRREGMWLMIGLGAAFASFGMWGIVDRELADLTTLALPDDSRLRWLRVARAIFGVIGGLGAALLIAGLLGAVLGRMMS